MDTQTVIELSSARRGTSGSAHLRNLWGIVIRGADDERDPERQRGLRDRTRGLRHLHYSPVHGRGLAVQGPSGRRFRRTLERVTRVIPPERLLTMLVRDEAREFDADLTALGTRPLVQPAWRGSAAELFLAALRVARDDPHATIALLPWDLLADHEATFMHCVGRAARAVHLRPDLVVVIGAAASRGVRGTSWIDAGDPIDGLEGLAVRAVRRFVSAPSFREAAALRESGGLLATRVLVAKVTTLLALGRSRLPDVLEALEPLEDAAPPEEDLLRDAVYESMPRADVTAFLGPRGDGFAVLPIPEFVEIEDGWSLPVAS